MAMRLKNTMDGGISGIWLVSVLRADNHREKLRSESPMLPRENISFLKRMLTLFIR